MTILFTEELVVECQIENCCLAEDCIKHKKYKTSNDEAVNPSGDIYYDYESRTICCAMFDDGVQESDSGRGRA